MSLGSLVNEGFREKSAHLSGSCKDGRLDPLGILEALLNILCPVLKQVALLQDFHGLLPLSPSAYDNRAGATVSFY